MSELGVFSSFFEEREREREGIFLRKCLEGGFMRGREKEGFIEKF